MTRRRSIRRVLLLVVAGALVPLAAISAMQGVIQLRGEREGFHAALADDARRAAVVETAMLASAEGVLAILASNPEVMTGQQGRCGPVLAEAARSVPNFSHFALLDATGTVLCAGNPAAVGSEFGEWRFWPDVAKADGFIAMEPVWGAFSNERIIGVFLPAGDGDARRLITGSLRLDNLERALNLRHGQSGRVVAMLDGRGNVVSASGKVPFARFDPETSERTLRDAGGRTWAFATAPLQTGGTAEAAYRIIFLAPLPGLAETAPSILSLFLLPFLALFLASLAIWVGANEAILRWVARLGASARAIADGEYRMATDGFAGAPNEIRGLAADLARMSRAIAERDQRLTDGIAQHRALALELHHRVRNNLQVVGSYLSLKGDAIHADGGRHALAAARLRVSALALVHRLLYDSGELTTVSTDSLLGELCELINSHAVLRRRIAFDCHIESLPVSIDAAVPISMWTVELVSMLVDRIPDEDVKTAMRLELIAGEGEMRLRIRAEGLASATRDEAASRALLKGIARQLGGRLEADGLDATDPDVTLVVPLETLTRK